MFWYFFGGFQFLKWLWNGITKPPRFPQEPQSASEAVDAEFKAAIEMIDSVLVGKADKAALIDRLRQSEERLSEHYPGLSTDAFTESGKALAAIPPQELPSELKELRDALLKNLRTGLPNQVPAAMLRTASAPQKDAGFSLRWVLVTMACLGFVAALVVMLTDALSESPQTTTIPHPLEINLVSFGARQTIKGHFGYASPMGPACPQTSNVTDAQLRAFVKQHCSTIIWIDGPGTMGAVYFINWRLPQGIFGSDEIADVLVRRVQQRQGAAFVQRIEARGRQPQTEQREIANSAAMQPVSEFHSGDGSIVIYADPHYGFTFEYDAKLLTESPQEETGSSVVFRAVDGHAMLECDPSEETFQSLYATNMALHPDSWDGDGASWLSISGNAPGGGHYDRKSIAVGNKSVTCDLIYDTEYGAKYEPEFSLLKRTLHFSSAPSSNTAK